MSNNNLSCARCQTPQARLSAPLKRCARCKTVQYCSTDCQKAAWPQHKEQCRDGHLAAAANGAQRNTFTLDLNAFLGRNSTPESDRNTIYYLRTSTPHLQDISMSGPFYPVEAIIPQILHNFGDNCLTGCQTFQELVRTAGAGAMQRISSPINGNSNQVKTIELIREHNPTIAARLPAPTWVVFTIAIAIVTQVPLPELVPIEEMDVHGTFDSETTAISEAKKIGRELVNSYRNGRFTEMPNFLESPESLSGTICFNAFADGLDHGNQRKQTIVQVRYEVPTAT